MVSLRTWRRGRCLGWRPCRWGSDAGWPRSRHTPPGDHRGWRRWTPACPCTPYTSSPPAAASAAPLGWGRSLRECGKQTRAHLKSVTVRQRHTGVDLWPSSPVAICVLTLAALELCLTSGSGEHKPEKQNVTVTWWWPQITNILHPLTSFLSFSYIIKIVHQSGQLRLTDRNEI